MMEVKLYQGLLELNWNLLFSLITVAVLVIILKHFFFEKVHNFMIAREKGVEDRLSEAETKNQEADSLKAKYEEELKGADGQKREIINNAKKDASLQADTIILEAHKKADAIVERAEANAKKEQERATAEMKDKVADLAVMAAEQIIRKDLKKEGQEELINDAIEEVGKGLWQEKQ